MHCISLIIRTSIMLAGMALAIGCTVSSSRYGIQPSVDPDSVIQINRHFEIPDNKARVYIQNGIPVRKGEIDKWSTYCSLLMQDLHTSGEPKLIVSPGRFNITRVLQFNDLFYFRKVFIASREWTYDSPSDVIYQVEMRLNSDVQPNVRALICVKHVDDYGRHYPTLAEIKIALRDAIEIDTP